MGTQIFAATALIAVVVTVVALGILHRVSALSPIRDAVSAYGISPFRWLYRVQTLATAVAAGAVAGALVPFPSSAAAVIALAALGIARALISWFPMDAPGAHRSAAGRIHNLLAFGAFAAASASGFLIAAAFVADAALTPFAPAVTVLGWFTTAAAALTLVAAVVAALRAAFGLIERGIYLGMLALLSVAAVALLLTT
jgi:hypothetical protein